MYLSDIQWFDYHQGIYEINNKKEMKICDSQSSRSGNNSLEHLRSPQSYSIDDEIKNMLSNTQIINEEFFHMTRNIKEPDQKERNKSCGKTSFGVVVDNLTNASPKNYNYKHYSSCCLNEYLNNTFLHSSNPNFYEENRNFIENSERNEEKESNEFNVIQMKKCLFHYKGITEKIEQHLNDKKAFIFAEIQHNFTNYYCKKYKKLVVEKFNHSDKLLKKKLQEKINFAFNELKDFIKAFQMAISHFYKLDEYQRVLKYFLFTKENLQNFLTSVIFDDQIYNLVYEAQNFLDNDLEIDLIEKLGLIKNSQPSDFDIEDKYCLNGKTLKYFNEKKKVFCTENNILQSRILSEINETEEAHTRKTSLTNHRFELELKESTIQKSEIEDDTYKLNERRFSPFNKAIKNLRKIQKLKSPLHKLKNMRITAELIEQEIKEFYQNFEIEFHDKIGGEEILPIHVYIISKADIASLFTHCAIVDKFLSSNLTSSISGYYLVTMQVSLKYILSLNKNEMNN